MTDESTHNAADAGKPIESKPIDGKPIEGKQGLLDRVGTSLGTSDWKPVTQEEINLFADATGDHQWIHIDPERAKEGPFGGTIAHGYWTLSVIPVLLGPLMRVEGVKMGVNYGLNKLRFPSPVPVGSRIRLHATLANVEEIAGGAQLTVAVSTEVEGSDKPAMVAEAVYRYYF